MSNLPHLPWFLEGLEQTKAHMDGARLAALEETSLVALRHLLLARKALDGVIDKVKEEVGRE